jgi:hypothetical protein
MSTNAKKWLLFSLTIAAAFLAWTGLVDLAEHVNVRMAAARAVVMFGLMIVFQISARSSK